MCMQVESKTMQVSSRVHASEAATFATHRNPTLGLRPPHPRCRLGSSAPLSQHFTHTNRTRTNAPLHFFGRPPAAARFSHNTQGASPSLILL